MKKYIYYIITILRSFIVTNSKLLVCILCFTVSTHTAIAGNHEVSKNLLSNWQKLYNKNSNPFSMSTPVASIRRGDDCNENLNYQKNDTQNSYAGPFHSELGINSNSSQSSLQNISGFDPDFNVNGDKPGWSGIVQNNQNQRNHSPYTPRGYCSKPSPLYTMPINGVIKNSSNFGFGNTGGTGSIGGSSGSPSSNPPSTGANGISPGTPPTGNQNHAKVVLENISGLGILIGNGLNWSLNLGNIQANSGSLNDIVELFNSGGAAANTDFLSGLITEALSGGFSGSDVKSFTQLAGGYGAKWDIHLDTYDMNPGSFIQTLAIELFDSDKGNTYNIELGVLHLNITGDLLAASNIPSSNSTNTIPEPEVWLLMIVGITLLKWRFSCISRLKVA